jgi:hypothetical protein
VSNAFFIYHDTFCTSSCLHAKNSAGIWPVGRAAKAAERIDTGAVSQGVDAVEKLLGCQLFRHGIFVLFLRECDEMACSGLVEAEPGKPAISQVHPNVLNQTAHW